MFNRLLNISKILNIPAFWIYRGSEYNRVVNVPGFWMCFWFRICQGSRYASGSEYVRVMNMLLVQNMSRFCICYGSIYSRATQGSEHAWIIPEYAWLCLNVTKSAWMAFCFTFTHCNPLSKGTKDCFLEE